MDRSTGILLIGGGVAAARCARTLRREGMTGPILLVGAEPTVPYNRPPLSKELLRDDLPDELLAAEPAGWYERKGVELLTATEVVELDPDARRAVLSDGSTVLFGRCLVATGAEPIGLPVPGAERALLLRTLADARRLRAALVSAGPGAAAAVIGGGFIGVEVASGFAAAGLRPTLIERTSALWGGSLGRELSAWAVERLGGAGVSVRLGQAVTAVEERGPLVGETRVDAAFTAVGVGVRPRVELARAAGLAVDDGIVVDAEQRTDHPGVWAAGDVARADGRRVEHWHAAREAGDRAARSMLGLDVPPIPPPWLFSEVAGTPLDVVGAADGWDEERWLRPGGVLAYLARGRTVMLAVIGTALPIGVARALVADGATLGAVEAAIPAPQA